jgi:uncharacterized Zn finger protein
MRRRWGYWAQYERRAPVATEDGIKARTRDFGKAWWSRHWIDALKTFGWDNRLSRGRGYARSGQVLDYTVYAGEVRASVQGSRRQPYDVRIRLRALDDRQWERVFDALAEQSEYAARLLAGEMPEDVDTVFERADAALLPRKSSDLQTECSCPDWANPCKHVAAVHYILAEALDADPFMLFALRGRERSAVLDALRARWGGAEAEEEPVRAAQAETLEVAGFWGSARDVTDLDVGLEAAVVRAPVLRRLGPPGAWTDADQMAAVFGPMLEKASQAARGAAGGT